MLYNNENVMYKHACLSNVCEHLRIKIRKEIGKNNRIMRGAVAWWLTPRTPDPEVGGSSPTRVAVLCP